MPPSTTDRRDSGTSLTIARWAARLVAAAILSMGAVPKFTGQAGALADALPGGMPVVLAIGAVELITVVLLLIPRTAVIGAGLATMVMLGAAASHFGPVGFDGEFATMFVMAIVALVAAAAATWLEWNARGRRIL